MRVVHLYLAVLGVWGMMSSGCARPPSPDWPVYLGDKASSQYSFLSQINRDNVGELQVAWTYDAGELTGRRSSQIQTNPIIVEGMLYGLSPRLHVFALDGATGEEIWRFDPSDAGVAASGVSRGVAYWAQGNDKRILYVAGSTLLALDATTGRQIVDFGQDGLVDLHDGLGRDVADLQVVASSPGIIYRNLLIQGTRVSEGLESAPGHIRAYDVQTGEIKWIFHTIPHPEEYGYETWPADAWERIGGANSWAGMSLDEARGIVYIPTGSAAFDFWGGNRVGENLFANSLIALNAATGERIWHFQTVHHDIWDRDLPAPPNLVTVHHDGKGIDAVAQITKSGYVFLFDRVTGEPLFPIEERPVPPSTLIGERTWPTQPLPVKPAPFARQFFTADDVTDISPESRAFVLDSLRVLQSKGQFIPFGTRGTIIFPGFDGGGEWGGAAVDPDGVLYVNANEMPWVARLIEVTPRPEGSGLVSLGAQTYERECAGCHGSDFTGIQDMENTTLIDLATRLSQAEARETVVKGREFMPGFSRMPAIEMDAVMAYLYNEAEELTESPIQEEDQPEVPYRFGGYRRFFDPEGYPAVKPPWGTLSAIDLNTGEYRWKITLGELPELTERGIPPTGTENYGGPVVTAGGVVFIAATKDEMFRAFDKDTGALLWQTKLPAGGYATPSTYLAGDRQYVVIAAGGGKMGTEPGNSYLAFALPKP